MSREDLNWTDKQLEALSFSGNMCILAGAGSGKTMTLVELLLRLVEGRSGLGEPIELNNVLALTYTEKAAREMRDRVRMGLNEKIRSADDPGFWIRQRRQLDRVLISTIHSFCLQVLKQYSLEAGLDPDFGLLAEDRDFFAETRREILLDWLEAQDDDLLDLLDYFSWKSRGQGQGLDRVLSSIFGHERTVGRPAAPAGDRDTDLGPLIETLIQAAGLVDSLAAEGRIKQGKKYFQVATGFSAAVREMVRTDMTVEEILAAAPVLGDLLTGNWYAAKPAKDLALMATQALTAEIGRRLALPVKEKLLALARRMIVEENRAKANQSSLDFDDLLLLTRRLLAGHTEIRKELKKRFRIILVDEFQDTNRLQADILAYLAEPEGREQAWPEEAPASENLKPGPRRLVIFGDPKQSIYRFRGAEVGVFNRLKEVITADPPGQGRLIPLDKNFRSQCRLIDFFNTFFPGVMPTGSDSEYGENDFQYSHRPDLAEGPAVGLLTAPKGENAFQDRELEAEVLARYIRSLLAGEKGVFVKEPGRIPQPGDVAVLLRRFTHLKAYEQAFRRGGLDFITVRGQGFYQCGEVWDLINLLFYLNELKDGPALLGLLRSPLVGLDDGALTVMARQDSGSAGLASYFDNPARPWPTGLSPDQVETLEKARSLLTDLTARAGRSFPAELVELAIEKTDYLAVLSAQPQGRQKVANVQRFIGLTRHMPPDALYSPGSMSRYLKSRLDDQQDDPEAQLVSQGTEAIQIMTIHQAKGLQFPIVLVPDIGAGIRPQRGPVLFGPDDCFALRLRDPETMESYKPNDYQEIYQDNQLREKAEYMRLLYVAATRAQDHLVFSGTEGENGKESWQVKLTEFASEHPELIARDESASREPGFTDQVNFPEVSIQTEPAAPTTLKPQAPSLQEFPPSSLTPQASSLKPPRAEAILNKVRREKPPQPSRITLNVTALTQYLSCPRRYYLENLIGLPAEAEPFLEGDPGQSAGAREKGTILHYLLETMELDGLPAQEVLMERAVKRAHEEGWSLPADQARDLAVRIREFRESPWGRELGQAGQGLVFRESPVWLRIQPEEKEGTDLILIGEIDLFFINPDGLARIVDYKFANPKEAGRYTPQLKAYALALKRAGLSRQLAAGLYFCGEKETRAVEIEMEPGWEEDFERLLRRTTQDLIYLEGPDQDGPEPPLLCPEPGCGLKYACV